MVTASPQAPFGPLQSINRGTPYAAQGIMAQLADEEAAEKTDEDEVEGGTEDEAGAEEIASEVADDAAKETEVAAETDSLVDEATARHGFSREEAEQLGDSLPSVLAALDRQATQLMRDKLRAEAPPEQEVPAAPVAEKKEPAKPIALPKKLELELDPDDYTEDQLKTFNKLTEHINQQAEAFAQQKEVLEALAQLAIANHGELSKITEQTTTQSSAEYAAEMNGIISALPEELADTYGKGPIEKLTDSEQVAARHKLEEEMYLLAEADRHGKKPIATRKQYADRALRVLNAEALTKSARKGLEKQITAQRRKGIARPSGRNGKPASADERARAVIREKLIEMGIGVDE